MKYMGSKRIMLQNGFGSAIQESATKSKRVVDLFSGSGAVSWYAAEKLDQPVLAVDLQKYSGVLAGAVIGRTAALDADKMVQEWLKPARKAAYASPHWSAAKKFDAPQFRKDVLGSRKFCRDNEGGLVWSAYGGHYFAPRQAILIDQALRKLPVSEPERSACLAALIAAAGYSAASPGHTAQPFSPTKTAMPYIREAWRRVPLTYAETWLRNIAPRHAKRPGSTQVGNAVDVAKTLQATDLVVIDPPYSAVQYSRFYHVLETLARHPQGESVAVEGVGRYPSIEDRPQSDFSLKGESKEAITDLLEGLSEVGCRALITFPKVECSNGLSGTQISRIAKKYFKVRTKTVRGRFSTLGGNGTHREARQNSQEMIISLEPVGSKGN